MDTTNRSRAARHHAGARAVALDPVADRAGVAPLVVSVAGLLALLLLLL